MNLLIELNSFHEEVIYGEYLNHCDETWILAKKNNYKSGLFKKLNSSYKLYLIEERAFFPVLKQINTIINLNKINQVTFITCENKFDILIFLTLRILNPKTNFNRFSHNIPKSPFKNILLTLAMQFSNKNFVIDNRVKVSFLRSKHQYKEVFYEKFNGIIDMKMPSGFDLKPECIYIVVIGSISFNRRNYNSLLVECQKLKNENVVFIILTNFQTDDGEVFYSQVKNRNLIKHFVFFDYYLNYSEFCRIIDISHASALLIDNTIPLIDDYTYYKVSSAVKFSEEFKKLVLVSTDFQLKLNTEVKYYQDTFISEAINELF